jgi:hypothetical protein
MAALPQQEARELLARAAQRPHRVQTGPHGDDVQRVASTVLTAISRGEIAPVEGARIARRVRTRLRAIRRFARFQRRLSRLGSFETPPSAAPQDGLFVNAMKYLPHAEERSGAAGVRFEARMKAMRCPGVALHPPRGLA